MEDESLALLMLLVGDDIEEIAVVMYRVDAEADLLMTCLSPLGAVSSGKRLLLCSQAQNSILTLTSCGTGRARALQGPVAGLSRSQ